MKKIIIWIVVVVVAIWAIVAITQNSSKNSIVTGKPIKIGAILMLTGVGANYGEHSLNGANLAIEEINSKGGVLGRKIEIVAEDNRGDNPSTAISAFNKLTSEDINLMIGPNWQPSSTALAPLVCEKSVIMISMSVGGSDFTKQCDFTFNTYPEQVRLSASLGKYVVGQGYKKIGLIGSQQSWEKEQFDAIKKSIEDNGGKIEIAEVVSGTETDFRTLLVKMKKANIDALVLTNYTNEDITVRQARDLGLKPQVFSVLIDDATIKDAEGALEGAIGGSYYMPTQKFVTDYTKRFDKTPDVSADTSYDAVNLIVEAIKNTGKTDSESVKEYLKNKKIFEGASGSGTFDEYGQVVREPHYQKVVNGKIEELKK
ncbi:MAG: ABC transporter substrate-binding protein [Patescibacteria group bacterium]